jgi:hypothetical protein
MFQVWFAREAPGLADPMSSTRWRGLLGGCLLPDFALSPPPVFG